jgi:hypothetical protein
MDTIDQNMDHEDQTAIRIAKMVSSIEELVGEKTLEEL